MRFWIVCLAIASIALSLPPVPKPRKRTATAVTQGAGAAALIAKTAVVVPKTNVWILPWRYGNINSNNYWWNLEASANFRQWSVVQSNVTTNVSVTINKNEKVRFYRLSGRTN